MKNMLKWLSGADVIAATGPAGSLGLLVLRISMGLMMAFGHGWGKLAAYGERAAGFPDPLGIGGPLSMALTVFAEFFCSLALVAGLFTRGVVIPLIITMLMAALVIHGDDPWGKKELALMYLFPYLTILIAGPGRYSLDALFPRR
jgi:putative oxidoreductase